VKWGVLLGAPGKCEEAVSGLTKRCSNLVFDVKIIPNFETMEPIEITKRFRNAINNKITTIVRNFEFFAVLRHLQVHCV
jgi:hypothetical protein